MAFLTFKVVLRLIYLLHRTRLLSHFALNATESLDVAGGGGKVLEATVRCLALLCTLAM